MIARNGIQSGQILKPSDLSWEPWPEGGIDKNYILIGTKTPENLCRLGRAPIAAGEPPDGNQDRRLGNRGFLAAVLHAGMRAVSVPGVGDARGIAGFVFPGDQVDLIVTYSIQDRPQVAQQVAGPLVDQPSPRPCVLRNVRVIAIDQKLDSKAGEAVVAKTATFEVTPKESEIIALASEMGKLSLSLRSLVPGPGELKHEISDSLFEAPNSPLSETYTVDSDVSLLDQPRQQAGRRRGQRHDPAGVARAR